jgi:hypothetical protein
MNKTVKTNKHVCYYELVSFNEISPFIHFHLQWVKKHSIFLKVRTWNKVLHDATYLIPEAGSLLTAAINTNDYL